MKTFNYSVFNSLNKDPKKEIICGKYIRLLTFIEISHLNLEENNTSVQVEVAENYTLLLTSKGDLFSSGIFNLVGQTDSFII